MLLLIVAPQLLWVPLAAAQEPDGSAWANEVAAVGQANLVEAKGTIMEALQGEPEAMKAVVNKYMIPAAIALAVIIVGYMVASAVGRVVGQLVANKVDLTLGKFLGKMTTNGIMVMVLLGALGYFGVDVTSFAAILAAAGFAVGMALQGTLSNFAAGVMLLVFRPFKVGDYIVVDGSEGTVDEIDLFTTRMNTMDNRHLIVPNGSIFGSTIQNYTTNPIRRVDVSVGAEYKADLRHTRQVLSDAIAVIPGAVSDPAPEVYLVDLGDSSVNWQCRVWCRPENYWEVRQRVTTVAKDALDNAGIGIPFPQMDLHLITNMAQQNRAA
jgi:small conductance mechanosensitive channel